MVSVLSVITLDSSREFYRFRRDGERSSSPSAIVLHCGMRVLQNFMSHTLNAAIQQIFASAARKKQKTRIDGRRFEKRQSRESCVLDIIGIHSTINMWSPQYCFVGSPRLQRMHGDWAHSDVTSLARLLTGSLCCTLVDRLAFPAIIDWLVELLALAPKTKATSDVNSVI